MTTNENLKEYLQNNAVSGKISEIINLTEKFYSARITDLNEFELIAVLCAMTDLNPSEFDWIMFKNPEVTRTLKGHTFEVVFDEAMAQNGIECVDMGGDSDIDRIIDDHSLQLKTQYAEGCSDNIVSYKTHKTHGAKSKKESLDYYHKIIDFASFLVGLVSYEPFKVMIIPKENLPRVKINNSYIDSPCFFTIGGSPYLNAFSYLGISKELDFSNLNLSPTDKELLPFTSKLLEMKSIYIIRSIFIKKNFRIWDMNIRGFTREYALSREVMRRGIKVYSSKVTGLPRANKCDLVLKSVDDCFYRFQVKGLTWSGCKINGEDTIIDCETQLSRGRVNDHPTQSRLYQSSDFEFLIIAVDPVYSNHIASELEMDDFAWHFYCIPTADLKKHFRYPNRIASHQNIPISELKKYEIDDSWFKRWKKES